MKTHFFEYLEFNFKLSTILILSVFTGLKQFIGEYIFSDTDFLIGISLLFLVYTISGSVKAWKADEFSLGYLIEKTIQKAVSYVLFIGGISILIKLQVGGHSTGWVQALDDYLYMGVACNLALNIIKNVNAINPGLVPPWIGKLFKEGAKTGKITKLI